MSSIDDLIRERLKKLKGDDQLEASTSSTQTTKHITKQSKKTAVEQVEDLLKQLSHETHLEDAYGKDKYEIDAQIRRRLERLKVWDLGPPRASFIEIGGNSPDVLNEILSRPDEGETLNDCNNSGNISAEGNSSDSDTTPNLFPVSCAYCGANPTIVCVDCYDELYCAKCFSQLHVPEDEHKTYKYVQKKGVKEPT